MFVGPFMKPLRPLIDREVLKQPLTEFPCPVDRTGCHHTELKLRLRCRTSRRWMHLMFHLHSSPPHLQVALWEPLTRSLNHCARLRQRDISSR
jgi:hypothetical protein